MSVALRSFVKHRRSGAMGDVVNCVGFLASGMRVRMGVGGSFQKEKRFALSVTQKAASICLRAPREMRQKRDMTPVTVADLAIQAYIAHELHSTFANDFLIGEEDASELPKSDASLWHSINKLSGVDAQATLARNRQLCKRFWTVDPIDGTKGFINGDSYGIGLALLGDGTGFPPIAALGLPTKDVILLADVTGRVLETYNIARRNKAPLNCHENTWMLSGADDLSLSGWPPWTPCCCGSLVKYAAVAQREAVAFVQVLPTQRANIWDHAAGVAAVIASGGIVTDEFGNGLLFGCGPGRRYLQLSDKGHAIVATRRGADHPQTCDLVVDALLSLRQHPL